LKVLFVHSGMPTFVQTDFDILSDVHDVRAFDFPSPHQGWSQIVKRLHALWQGVQWADLTFSWFGKLHAFFAVFFSKVLGKKSVVVVSGGEVCRFSFGNGRYRSLCTQPFKRWFPQFVARQADILLPVSDHVYSEAIESVRADPQRMKMVYHGFDTTRFRPLAGIEKQKIAITVAEVMDESLYNKGLLDFIKAAELAPDVSYVLIGPNRNSAAETLRAQLPKNALMMGGVYGDDLVEQLSGAKVYVQASVSESFGCAVAEGMACECVPVVSQIPALEEVVGDCGLYLDNPITPEEIADKVQMALLHPELGKRARERVIKNFSLELRRRELIKAVASLERGNC
jgi:glycosyltransferase involved in cell wall biosynthesis